MQTATLASTSKQTLPEKIIAMERQLRATWEQWETAMAGVTPHHRCPKCASTLVLLRDCSIAESRRWDKLVTRYDSCWNCEPRQSLYWRMKNVGMVVQKLSQQAINKAMLPATSRRYAREAKTLAIGWIANYPNGSYARLSELEIFAKLTGQKDYMRKRIDSDDPFLLVITADVDADSLAHWMQREAPLWIADRTGLLRAACASWPA